MNPSRLLTPYNYIIVNVIFNGETSLIIEYEKNTSAIHPPNNPLMLYGAWAQTNSSMLLASNIVSKPWETEHNNYVNDIINCY